MTQESNGAVAGYNLLEVKGSDEKKKENDAEKESPRLSHLDSRGRASMVDVTDKATTDRTAQATGTVILNPEIVRLLQASELKKGDALTVAQVAGVLAAKQTWGLIPLCHSIPLNDVQVSCVFFIYYF